MNTNSTLESCNADVPLVGYLMNNSDVYDEEELSVENLLPSFKPEDFPAGQDSFCIPLTTDHTMGTEY